MPDKCILDPERDCLGLIKAKEVEGDVKVLDRRLSEFQQAVTETNSRFGGRIGALEAQEQVRQEQFRNIREKLEDITKDVAEFQREQKGSISELRKEHRESMEELKKGNKEILDTVTPLKLKVKEIDKLSEDVDALKEKPGETWEHLKKQGLGWLLALLLAIVAVALGLGKYL